LPDARVEKKGAVVLHGRTSLKRGTIPSDKFREKKSQWWGKKKKRKLTHLLCGIISEEETAARVDYDKNELAKVSTPKGGGIPEKERKRIEKNHQLDRVDEEGPAMTRSWTYPSAAWSERTRNEKNEEKNRVGLAFLAR